MAINLRKSMKSVSNLSALLSIIYDGNFLKKRSI